MSAGTIGITEVAVGVPFPVAALEICRYALGPAVAAAALHAEAVPASQATAAGFAHELTSAGDLLDRARDVARSLGSHAPGAYQLTKQQLQRPTPRAIADQVGGVRARCLRCTAGRGSWRGEAAGCAASDGSQRRAGRRARPRSG